jgi:hypothetical protein
VAKLPTQAVVRQVQSPEGTLVVLELRTPTGIHATVWDIASAKGLAASLDRAASPVIVAG